MTKHQVSYEMTTEYSGDSVAEFYAHLAEVHKIMARGEKLIDFRVRIEPIEDDDDE